MKRLMSVGLPVAALVVALSAADARAQSYPWSVSFDMGTQVALFDDYTAFGMDFGYRQFNLSDRFAVQGGRRWSMPITGGITVRF